MPYFILPVLWAVCVCAGSPLLIVRRWRPLGIWFIVASTASFLGAMSFSVIFPILTLLILKVLNQPDKNWLAVIAWLIGMLAGGIAGSDLRALCVKSFAYLSRSNRNAAAE
jgi:hypothetical protein